MAQILKQSTTVTLKVGPFLDATDGVTEETALTPGIEIAKDGAAFAARNSATAVSHDAEGYYDVELDGTDTGTLGRLVLKAHDSANHLPVRHEFTVVPANVYDSLVGGSDTLQADLTQVSGSAVATGSAQLGVNVVNLGGSAVQQTSGHIHAFDDAGNAISTLTQADILSDATPFAGANVDAAISTRSSHAAADVWSVGTRTLTANTNLNDPDAATIADAVWDESRSGHTTAGTFGEGVASVQGNVTGSVNSVSTSVTVGTNNDKTGYQINGTKNTLDDLNDLAQSDILSDVTPFAGANVDAAISSRSNHSAADVWAVATRELTSNANFNDPTAASVADAVWDEARSGHTTVGTFGEGIASVQGNVTGSVNSVTTSVTVGTNNDKTGYSISGTKNTLDDLNDITAAAVWSVTTSEPSAVFAWGGSRGALVDWLGALSRNKITQTSTTQTLRDDADAADVATSAVSDDGTTFTRGEWS